VFREFHNDVPRLLCACWVHWSIGVIDGQPGPNSPNHPNGENGWNPQNGENTPP
jgi:hypothetical protein